MSEQATAKIEIEIRDLGVVRYGEALAIQNAEHERVVIGGDPVILLVEHPSVLTLGKNADPRFLLHAKTTYESNGVEIVETDRGGEVTAHLPGQLVVYPIVPIARMSLTPRKYIYLLEESVIRSLKRFDLTATRDSEHPGVWIGVNKVCAVGVRIRRRVAMHGIALNVNNNLDLFTQIVPCGIRFRGVTTMSREVGRPVEMISVKSVLTSELRRLLMTESDVD